MISKSSKQAINAVMALANLEKDCYAGANLIAEQTGAPQNYLGKLLQLLARQRLLVSQKGLGGGFQLAKSPRDISLYEIVEPIDHISRWNGCFLGNEKCLDENPCALHSKWKKIRDAYLEFLKDTTVADLLKKAPAVK